MKLTCRLLRDTANMLKYYSQFQPLPLSLKAFVRFGASWRKPGWEEDSFQFLQTELLVRLANIMTEITHLPDNLLTMPSVACVKGWYDISFKELLEFVDMSSPSEDDLSKFTKTLVHIRNRHSSVVETMAQGMIELKETGEIDLNTEKTIQYFLDRFYMSRISIRMLINQHAGLFGPQASGKTRHIGCIDPQCNIREAVEGAYEDAKFLCEQYYQVTPGLHIECRNAGDKTSPDVDIMYVPSHLHHMLFELFKNAMRATVEYYSEASDLPVIKVLICKGEEDLCIKMSDRGGGIARSTGDLLFHYMYSTAPHPSHIDSGLTPLAGYGYGLPISRLYARYFHGDLVLNSVEGYGTEASIYLKVQCDQASEVLPVYNSTASKVYKTDIPVNDWSSPQSWLPNTIPQRNLCTRSSHRSPSPAHTSPDPTSQKSPDTSSTAQKSPDTSTAHKSLSISHESPDTSTSQKSPSATPMKSAEEGTSVDPEMETLPTPAL